MTKTFNTTKSILVTGGAGFVGTHLCERLASNGFMVRSLDLKAPTRVIAGAEYIRGDVRNSKLLKDSLSGVDAVFHLAATVSVPLCQKDPIESYSNNFLATLGLLEALREKKIPLVFASTAAVYASKGDDGRALKESDTSEEFFSFYAAQKHASEKAIDLYSRCFGIPATVFRFFNIYGAGQDPSSPYSGVITVFKKLSQEGKALPLNGGGIQTRDFISVHDIVSACEKVLSIPLATWNSAPINLGSGTKITIKEIAEIINQRHGNSAGHIEAPAREGDVVHSLANIDRAKTILQFSPQQDLAKGLQEI